MTRIASTILRSPTGQFLPSQGKKTTKNAKLAKIVAENAILDIPLSKREMLLRAGYSNNMATHNAEKVLSALGTKARVRELGLDEDLITNSLKDDIQNKEGRRVRELELGARILGMTADPEAANKTLVINISGESATRYSVLATPQEKEDVKQLNEGSVEPLPMS